MSPYPGSCQVDECNWLRRWIFWCSDSMQLKCLTVTPYLHYMRLCLSCTLWVEGSHSWPTWVRTWTSACQKLSAAFQANVDSFCEFVETKLNAMCHQIISWTRTTYASPKFLRFIVFISILGQQMVSSCTHQSTGNILSFPHQKRKYVLPQKKVCFSNILSKG